MKRKIILLLVTLWISIFIISGCSMMPHLNASAQTVIDTKKELLAEIENALSSGKTKISFVTSDLDQTDFDTLNQNIEGFYGVVKEYQIKSVKFLNKSYVTLNCEISDQILCRFVKMRIHLSEFRHYVQNYIRHVKRDMC